MDLATHAMEGVALSGLKDFLPTSSFSGRVWDNVSKVPKHV
jgi:hypothetical protein